jgi:hypothetical protein
MRELRILAAASFVLLFAAACSRAALDSSSAQDSHVPRSLDTLVGEPDAILVGTVSAVLDSQVLPTETPPPGVAPDEIEPDNEFPLTRYVVTVDDLLKDQGGQVGEAPSIVVALRGLYPQPGAGPEHPLPEPGAVRLWFLRARPGHAGEWMLAPGEIGMLTLAETVTWPDVGNTPVTFAVGMTPAEFVEAVREEVAGG